MQDKSPNSGWCVDTQRWTGDELNIVRELAMRRARRADLLALFPDRSPSAVKLQIHKARKAMGLARAMPPGLCETEPTMLDRNDPGLRSTYPERFAKQAARSNERFLAALMAA